jgi:hypothetical protein
MEQAAFDLEWQVDPEADAELRAMLERAESQVVEETSKFRREARQEIEDIRARLAVVALLKHPPIEVRKNCCNEVNMLGQHLGDVMASFGCQLGTDVAYSLKNLIEMAPEANNCLARAVDAHLLVLDNILREGLCGDGGDAGDEIMTSLQRVCNLANMVEIPAEIDVIAI